MFDPNLDADGKSIPIEATEGTYNWIIIEVTPDCEESPDFNDPDFEIATGTFDTVASPEGVFELLVSQFSDYSSPGGNSPGLVVVGDTGAIIHDFATGAVQKDLTNVADTSHYYGGVTGPSSLLIFGSKGTFNPSYAGGWTGGSIKFANDNITDGCSIADTSGNPVGLLVVNNTTNEITRMSANSDFGFSVDVDPLVDTNTTGASGLSFVSIYSPAGDGAFLGLSDGSPGKLIHVSSNKTSPTVTVVGDVGDGPRKIKCLGPNSSTCLVSNYNGNSLSIIDWPTRSSSPTIRGQSVSIQGPVGVDIASVNNKTLGLATGYGDNSLHIIDIGAASASDNNIALSDCQNPGHAIFLNGGSHIAVTCNGNDKLKIITTP